MFSGEIIRRGRDAGVPEDEMGAFVVSVHSKSAYLFYEDALESSIRAYASRGKPTQTHHGTRHMTSGTHVPKEA